ncbi:hypothetical protein F5X99DRAFT_324851 [Biscogniauxia marginata]|nr:hypothetical protein F5X99DRAFT_324851 [Biscogniauxia marginata]
MFGGLPIFGPSVIGPPPKNVPPPTPVKLPRCNHQLPDSSETPSEGESSEPFLVRFLQTLHRPADLNESHFAALGVHVHSDVPAEGVVPDPSYLPSASGWEGIDLDEARRRDSTFRRPLNNGSMSPEARVYLERRTELSIPNQAAFRTTRRIKLEPGKQPLRLGNCYEFFKQMEFMAAFWDDTSLPPLSESDGDNQPEETAPALPPRPNTGGDTTSLEQAGHAAAAAGSESNTPADAEPPAKPDAPERVTYRTGPGNQMPAELRHHLVAAFIKLVAYDFGCNVAPPRLEPRLHLLEPPPTPAKSKSTSKSKSAAPAPTPFQKASYFPSGCVFLARIPTTREAARAGCVDGPVAAVSTRNTTGFATASDVRLDLGRELVAALVTAQHRARAGKEERRFGEGKWWATAPRWGGGEGGPIGREVEGDPSIVGDKDAVVAGGGVAGSEGPGSGSSSSSSPVATTATNTSPGREKGVRPGVSFGLPPLPLGVPVRGRGGGPVNKRPRKNHQSVYDSYRTVRPPSSNWDRKVRYEAIGRVPGADYDDVFVISSLFHHLSVLRVRVPARLLEVLDGAPEEEGEEEEEEEGDGSGSGTKTGDDKGGRRGRIKKGRSWGKLEVWRSRWFDLFQIEERLEAMRLLWGVMAWVMRKDDGGRGEAKRGPGQGGGRDVDMAGT